MVIIYLCIGETLELKNFELVNKENEMEDRTKNDIEKVNPNPGFLSKYIKKDDSLNALKEHRTVPRFKIIQPTTDQELAKQFGVGSCIVRPGDTLVSQFEGNLKTFQFVPLFFVCEWAKWRDLKGTGPMILERSADVGSDLARRSKSASLRKELYPGQEHIEDEKAKMYFSYVEHLRFIGVIYGDHPLAGTPVTLSFERGEWRQGKNFISAISMRRVVIDGVSEEVPLWSQVWDLTTVFHNPEASKKWYGFKFSPATPNIITEDEASTFEALHEEFKELAAKQQLTVQDDGDGRLSKKAEGEVPQSDEF